MIYFGRLSKIIFTQRMAHHVFPSMKISKFAKSLKIEQIDLYSDSHNEILWKKMIVPMSIFSNKVVLNHNPGLNFVPDSLKQKTFFTVPLFCSDIQPDINQLKFNKILSSRKTGNTSGSEIDNFKITTKRVFFSGATNGTNIGKVKRREYLDFLIKNGIPLSGYPKFKILSYEEYILNIKCSLMSLNFSWYNDEPGVTGRSFETFLCDSLLIENENKYLEKFFTPDVHYITFNSKETLLDKIKYIQNHESEALEISKAGGKRMREIFPIDKFWKKVLTF